MMELSQTEEQYRAVIAVCRKLYKAKFEDYGTAWRILRPSSLTDQIFIKAKRIRSIQIQQECKVQEGVREEFIGIVNYSIMALIQLELGESEEIYLSEQTAMEKYDFYANKALELMMCKNHDYGEAWRSMRVSSLTDIILMKILRVKNIEDNAGRTKVSEGLDANYLDMLNYAVFSLIRLQEEEKTGK